MKLVKIGRYAFSTDVIDYIHLLDDPPSLIVSSDDAYKQIHFDTPEQAEAEFDRVIQYVNHGPSEE